MEYAYLLSSLEEILGKGSKRSRDNHAFYCPFCHHQKKKLEINLHTSDRGENPWNCWVCGTKGKTISSLLSQMKVSPGVRQDILQYVPNTPYGDENRESVEIPSVELPKEFLRLDISPDSSKLVQKIKQYLYRRGLTDLDFTKYDIGYCMEGKWEGRVIIPSYQENGKLNYFIGRSFEPGKLKYLYPDVSRNIIVFENLINWTQPIILCEGVFDVVGGARRNAIPLLGKTLSQALLIKLIQSPVEEIFIALDRDALKEALRNCETLVKAGKRVYLVEMEGKDPSEMGFEKFTLHIQNSKELTFSKILEYKLGF